MSYSASPGKSVRVGGTVELGLTLHGFRKGSRKYSFALN